MKAFSPDVLAELGKYDSPTICNVIELFDYEPRNVGFLSPAIRAIYPDQPPIVGYAVTATCRSAAPARPGESSIGLPEQVAGFDRVPEPRIVVIQDLDDPPLGAVFGEVMTSSYQGFGCIGLVTNGHARDILAVEQMKFPCFAVGTSVSHVYPRLLSEGEPVHVGGVTIRPGDLLHADANGVTTMPLEIAETVAGACAEFIDIEAVIIGAARDPKRTLDSYRAALVEANRRLKALAARVKGSAKQTDTGEAMP